MKNLLLVAMVLFLTDNTYAQWQPDVRLTYDPAYSITTLNKRCIATNGNDVHAVWFDTRDGNDEIYYKRSNDKGISWGPDVRLTNASYQSRYPSVSVSGLNVHIIWFDGRDADYEIYYKQSTDGGITWGADTRLTYSPGHSFDPAVATSGSAVHVVWFDDRDGGFYELYYKCSNDGGITWGADTRLTNYTGSSADPCIAVSGSNVHIVWGDDRDGNNEIYYKNSTDGGLTWVADRRLTNDPAISKYPSVSVSGQDIHIVWHESRDGSFPWPPEYEIYYKRSTDAGLTWGTDTRLTNNPAMSTLPCIATIGSFVNISWTDSRDGNQEIYYKRSRDAGLTWDSDTRLTNNSASSSAASIAASPSVLHVLWYDSRDGLYEIYYKRLEMNVIAHGTSDYNGYNISCYGGNNGEAEAFPAGGLAPYTYLWDDPAGQTTKVATGLHAGTYTVIVTDADGSTATATCTLTEPAPLLIEAGLNQTVYLGYPPASCAILEWSGASGGVPPYVIAWSTGQTTKTITVCPAVTTDYTVTITDANNCVFSDQVKVCVIDVRCGNNLNKVQICHIPPGNPGNPQTLCVAVSAVPDHLAHGDMLGACGIDRSCTEVKSGIVAEIIAEVNYCENSLKASPNPFSENLTITFSCLAGGKATLKLIDFNGKEVARPFENYIETNITYQVEFNGSSLSPGLYFCVLQQDNGTMKRIKLILLN